MSDEVLSPEEIEALISQANDNKPEDDNAAASGPAAAPENSAAPSPQGVKPVELSYIHGGAGAQAANGVDLIMDVQLQVTVELGRTKLTVRDVLALGAGSVVELDKHAGEPVEVVVNNKTIARGEVVVIDENFGVRITEIVSSEERSPRAKAA